MRYTPRAYIALFICCLLGACDNSFTNDFINSDGQDTTAMLRVPIMPELFDPQFDVTVSQSAPSRRHNAQGEGVLESWSQDTAKWKKAKFHVFAYETQNMVNSQPHGQCDMRNTVDIQNSSILPDTGKVLLYDRIMRIQSDDGNNRLYARLYSNLSATEPTDFFYPTLNQLTRYKFYGYYADNVEAQNIQCTTNTVKGEITIDGTQDVMHAFAYHSTEEFWNNIKILKDKNVSENELRMLCNPDDYREGKDIRTYNNYLYSAAAAHRGFQPLFHLTRLMTRINVYVAGGGLNYNGSEDYKNIAITGLSILRTKTKGTLTIANDEWDATTYQADNTNIVSWSKDAESIKDLRFPIEIMDSFPNREYYDESKYPALASFPELKKNHINVKSSTDPIRIAEPLLLAPSESYTIHIDMLYANRATADEKAALNPTTPFLRRIVEHTVSLRDFDPNKYVFQQGNEYSIIIYVFGAEEVSISVEMGRPWNYGGTIPIDTEEASRVLITTD